MTIDSLVKIISKEITPENQQTKQKITITATMKVDHVMETSRIRRLANSITI